MTAARLSEIAAPLVEIHGQHEQQRLLDERTQRDLLDAYGDHEALRATMAEAVGRWRDNRTALAELALDPREVARQLAIHEHESAEIAAARLRPGESEEIRARLEAAQHGETIARLGGGLHEALVGEPGGARDSVAEATRSARQLGRLDRRYERLADRLAGVEAELSDIAEEARELVEGVDHDPRELQALEERLSLIYALERRYGDDEAAVIAYGERAATETRRLAGMEGERVRRTEEDARLLVVVANAATALSRARATTGCPARHARQPGD